MTDSQIWNKNKKLPVVAEKKVFINQIVLNNLIQTQVNLWGINDIKAKKYPPKAMNILVSMFMAWTIVSLSAIMFIYPA